MQMQLEFNTFLTVFAAVATVIGTVYAFLRNFKQDIKAQIEELDADIKSQITRTDQLYLMYVEGQKSIMETQKNMDQKFYDILKEKGQNSKNIANI